MDVGIFAGVFGVLVGLDMLVLHRLSGDPLFRLHVVSTEAMRHQLEQRMTWQGADPFARMVYLGGRLWRESPFLVVQVFLLAALLLYLLLKRRNSWRVAAVLLLFSIFPVLYFALGSVSLHGYLGMPIQPRYYAVAIVPLAISSGFVIEQALIRLRAQDAPDSRREARWAAIAVVIVLFIGSFELARNAHRAGTIYQAEYFRAAHSAVELIRSVDKNIPIVVESGPSSRAFEYGAYSDAVVLERRIRRGEEGTGPWALPEQDFVILFSTQTPGCLGCLREHVVQLEREGRVVVDDFLPDREIGVPSRWWAILRGIGLPWHVRRDTDSGNTASVRRVRWISHGE
jgi:hypothetical protein